MKPLPKKRLFRIFILLLVSGVLAIGYILLTSYIECKIEDQLVAINGRSGSIQVNLINRSLHLRDVEILPSHEIPIGLKVNTIDIHGIHFYSLLVNKKLTMNGLHLDSGKLYYRRSAHGEGFRSTLESVKIKKLSLTNILAAIKADTLTNFSSILNLDIADATFEIDSGKLNYAVKAFEGSLKEIMFNRNEDMYKLHVGALQYSSEKQKIIVDSALLIPNYGKFEFAHHKGEQVGRISISLPRLTIEGISLSEILDTSFTVSKIEINSFDLYSFKDKRVPFLRKERVPLPMESFQQLKYPVSIDSILVTESRVTLEEVAEGGAEPGTVVIDHINAACGLATNRYRKGIPSYAVLKASGVLMGEGDISAVLSLPLDGSNKYMTTGRISNFPFKKLNPALEPLRFRIESGHINNMKFDFHYTDFQSIGTLEIDYEDLRIIGLKKNKDNPSEIKTLLINALVKNNKDGTLSKVARTGSINIDRDKRKHIFNVWWKSILDGLRSAIIGSEKSPN